MKIAALFTLVGAITVAGPVLADTLGHDPTGAPYCIDASSELAPLSRCLAEGQAGFRVKADREGALACVDAKGAPAAARNCLPASPAVSWRVADPSGAPMCFDAHGAKAPLARCGPARELAQN